jgi:uncharacterized Zn finger protein (UPF0148 family)
MSEPNRCPKCDCELAEFDGEVIKCARCGYIFKEIVGIDEDGEYAQKKQIAQLQAEVERLTRQFRIVEQNRDGLIVEIQRLELEISNLKKQKKQLTKWRVR